MDFCPKCKSDKITLEINKYECKSCGFVLYKNTASAVCVILSIDNKILFVTRNKEPKKSMLDLPGGFVDYDETAENACKREIMEELNLNITNLKYIMSRPNTYPYKNIIYKTCDLAFVAEIKDFENLKIEKEEIKSVELINPKDIDFDKIAFTSIRDILEIYLKKKTEQSIPSNI